MIETLLGLPAHLRRRLSAALTAGTLEAPYSASLVRNALGTAEHVEAVGEALRQLETQGFSGAAVAMALNSVDKVLSAMPSPDLVWSGPEVPGLHARDTRAVFDELVGEAERSLWISSYTFFDGPKAFKVLSERMDDVDGLEVGLLLNIQRRKGDAGAPDAVAAGYAEWFWSKAWPGVRRPSVYYDPRSLHEAGPEGVLHAKAVVMDDQRVFITSANLTESAFDKNIEMGLVLRDSTLAAGVSKHFRSLIERGLLDPLPG